MVVVTTVAAAIAAASVEFPGVDIFGKGKRREDRRCSSYLFTKFNNNK